MKKFVYSVAGVFIAWSVLDVIIHGVLLQSSYDATQELWRPMEEMKMGLMSAVTLVVSAAFVGLYSMTSSRSVASGLRFGVLFGIATGVSMGFGMYGVMPFPLSLAFSWFGGTLLETAVAGAIVGAILKEGSEE